jgi:hypothetical protein
LKGNNNAAQTGKHIWSISIDKHKQSKQISIFNTLQNKQLEKAMVEAD